MTYEPALTWRHAGSPCLIVTRGLPGSGKTTYAREWVAANRRCRARVNKDDLRAMVDNGVFVKGVTESRILAARDAVILALLSRGYDVICDDTNLPEWTVSGLEELTGQVLAGLVIADFTGMPLETCIERDAARTGQAQVGEDVIRGMHEAHLAGWDVL